MECLQALTRKNSGEVETRILPQLIIKKGKKTFLLELKQEIALLETESQIDKSCISYHKKEINLRLLLLSPYKKPSFFLAF